MKESISIGSYLKRERLKEGLSQQALARRADIQRLKLVRLESGKYSPTFDEVVKLAKVLKLPLQRFLDGKFKQPGGLKGIALELNHLGIRDLAVEDAAVPGSFRRPEQIVALAVRGDRPDPRVVHAIPVVLANHPLNPGLAFAFANFYDRRVQNRLAWLCDVTLTLGRLGRFPIAIRTQDTLEKITKKAKKPAQPDNLGFPGATRIPLWKRWNITYGGKLSDFVDRAVQLVQGQIFEGEE